jgi:hypothetical protein
MLFNESVQLGFREHQLFVDFGRNQTTIFDEVVNFPQAAPQIERRLISGEVRGVTIGVFHAPMITRSYSLSTQFVIQIVSLVFYYDSG